MAVTAQKLVSLLIKTHSYINLGMIVVRIVRKHAIAWALALMQQLLYLKESQKPLQNNHA